MLCRTQENAGRLKGYKANLVLFPRHGRKPKAGEATAEERGAAVQLAGKTLMALPRSKPELETVEITEEMQVCARRACARRPVPVCSRLVS